MLPSAKLSKLMFSVFLINVGLVACVACFRTATAQQIDSALADDLPSIKPDVQIPPNDPPSLPPASSVESSVITPLAASDEKPLGVTPPSGNDMVMEEIRKAIRDGRQDLEIPPLSYPALSGIPSESVDPTVTAATTLVNPLSSSHATAHTKSLQALEQRLKTIASLTQSAQSLLKESQLLQTSGQQTESAQLLTHAKSLQALIGSLANDSK